MHLDPTVVRRKALHLALCAAFAGIGLAAQVAHAAVVVSTRTIPVPYNMDGVYVNVVTGGTSALGTGTPGWDVNPYFPLSPGSDVLGFFASTADNNNRGIITTPLVVGSTLSTANTFAVGAQRVGLLPAGIYNFGFRFANDVTTQTNVGYLTMQVSTRALTMPYLILGWAYENTGGSLTVTPVPEPSAALLLVGGLLAGAAWRKRLAKPPQS
jgi:hypothetical protein